MLLKPTFLTVVLIIAAQTIGGAARLPDLSGLAAVADDVFLAVHDSKETERGRPRISLIRTTKERTILSWTPLETSFPGGTANDIESISNIPELPGYSGPKRYILAESSEGQKKNGFYRRIFLAAFDKEKLKILAAIRWPEKTHNVEAIAVARIGEKHILIYAERGHGKEHAEVRYADLSLEPFVVGEFKSAGVFSVPGFVGKNVRPITAMDVGASGEIYAAAAEDPQGDEGPFRSVISRIGKVNLNNGSDIALYSRAIPISVLEGTKVEGLLVCGTQDKDLELIASSDNERFGGSLNQIPLAR
jgi:hypothetical protein